ncbi:MAG TPA: sugar transferase [Phycisphaerae bacterium]|nr:sugar transferase [Phycisphaerae bacterium]HQA00153.1 sugar transferase [Phycisphaerae bacterium]HQE27223.1 sugar transferase [Phycisphaerae bacterium]
MAFDLTSANTAVYPLPPAAPARRAAPFPRLLTVDDDRGSSRGNWLGTLGNSLLETPWLAWSAFDAAIMSAGVAVAYRNLVWTPEGAWIVVPLWQTCLVQCLTLVLSGLVFGLYEQQTLLRRSRILARSVLSTAVCITLSYVVISLFLYSVQSRQVLFLAAAFYLLIAPACRLAVCRCISGYSRKFIIVGTDRKSRLSVMTEGDGLSRRYQLVGYVTLEPIEVGHHLGGHPVLGTIDDIEQLCIDHEVNEVVVGPGPAKNPRVLDRVLGCLRLGCRVTNLSTFYEQVLSEIPVDHLEPHWFLFADLKHYRESQLIMKRAVDIVGATLGLLLTLPFWPLIALAIKLNSPGPVFYSQQRVGLNGRPFWLHKFRTMNVGAERNGHQWAAADDPRVTTVGWYLRRSRLDELPQLWNILRGQMSIVGPRPERPEFVVELAPKIRFYNERHLVKPGLTGWAQINYRYGASVEDAKRKLQLDLWYIKHMSIELDFTICLRTLGTVFLGSR